MTAPRLSLVVAGSDPLGPRPELVKVLAAQLRDGTVEIVVASASDCRAAVAALPGCRFVACAQGATVPCMRAAGLAAARAPIVALTEDFCTPAPGWVDAILTAHRLGRGTAVGGPVDRRDGRMSDWALTFLEYGRFLDASASVEVDDLPGINVSFRADVLSTALGGLPDEYLEMAVHPRLRSSGHRFWRESDAVMFDHARFRWCASLRAQYHHGRLYAGRRYRDATPAARLARLAVLGGVPLVLFLRIARGARAAGRGAKLAASFPTLLCLLCAWTAGELAGTALGEGRSGECWR